MNHSTYKMQFGKGSTATVLFTACWHVGNPQCRVDKIEALMARVRDERIPWVMLGDIVESIGPWDTRYHAESHGETIMLQLQHAAELVSIGGDTMLGLHVGNHEYKLAAKVGDITADLLKRAGCDPKRQHLGGAHNTRLLCPRGFCDMFTAHSRIGVGGGTSDPDRDMVTRQIRLRRLLTHWQADLKVVAHGHRAVIAPPVSRDVLVSTAAKELMTPVVVKPEWCAMCPSMFASYSRGHYPSYAEIALYPPTDIGWVEAEVDKGGKVVNVEAKLIR